MAHQDFFEALLELKGMSEDEWSRTYDAEHYYATRRKKDHRERMIEGDKPSSTHIKGGMGKGQQELDFLVTEVKKKFGKWEIR